jgi:feruloyl-CoA synthase
MLHKTIANLKQVSPTSTFNVPAGYTLLCEALEAMRICETVSFRTLTGLVTQDRLFHERHWNKMCHFAENYDWPVHPVMSGYGTAETAR